MNNVTEQDVRVTLDERAFRLLTIHAKAMASVLADIAQELRDEGQPADAEPIQRIASGASSALDAAVSTMRRSA